MNTYAILGDYGNDQNCPLVWCDLIGWTKGNRQDIKLCSFKDKLLAEEQFEIAKKNTEFYTKNGPNVLVENIRLIEQETKSLANFITDNNLVLQIDYIPISAFDKPLWKVYLEYQYTNYSIDLPAYERGELHADTPQEAIEKFATFIQGKELKLMRDVDDLIGSGFVKNIKVPEELTDLNI